MPTAEEKLRVIEARPRSVGRMFYDRVSASADRPAFRFPDTSEVWHSITWAEAGERVTRLAAGLMSLGIKPGDRVAIAASTRYEWILADLAINAARAATTTVYPTTIADDVAYILADSQSRIVFAEDAEQLAKLLEQKSQLPEVEKVVLISGEPGVADGDWVLSLDELAQLGQKALVDQPHAVQERVDATEPHDLATLIYTSGTTGRPKGVRLTHDAWTYEGVAVAANGFLTIDDLEFRWLPLAHSFGKVLLTSQLAVGFECAVDGRVPKIVDNLAVVKPTFMGAAPRIFEKAYGRIVTMMLDEGGIKLKLFRWAEKVSLDASRRQRAGQPVPTLLRLQHGLADRLVCQKIRDRFGGRVRFFISGSAALSTDIAEWFHSMGVLILEGYGLTETAAGTTVNHPDNFKIGTVGLPMAGTELKIAEDGELLVRGPGVMQGYHHLDAETRSTLHEDGWLATGDIAEIDADGFCRITDRKKDLFKTSGGKYVAPSHVEGIFKAVCPLASQMIVHGNGRKFCSALITLDPDAVAEWAGHHGLAGQDYATIVASPQIQELVAGHVDELNAKLNRWETIKKWAILDRDLSVEGGEITPSLKVRRRVVETNNEAILNSFYDD